ncbi:hypothetical protein Tco_0097360 [Tanacetum coccineum]
MDTRSSLLINIVGNPSRPVKLDEYGDVEVLKNKARLVARICKEEDAVKTAFSEWPYGYSRHQGRGLQVFKVPEESLLTKQNMLSNLKELWIWIYSRPVVTPLVDRLNWRGSQRDSNAVHVGCQDSRRMYDGKCSISWRLIGSWSSKKQRRTYKYQQQGLHTLPCWMLGALLCACNNDLTLSIKTTSSYVTISSEEQWKLEWLNSTSWKTIYQLVDLSHKALPRERSNFFFMNGHVGVLTPKSQTPYMKE